MMYYFVDYMYRINVSQKAISLKHTYTCVDVQVDVSIMNLCKKILIFLCILLNNTTFFRPMAVQILYDQAKNTTTQVK